MLLVNVENFTERFPQLAAALSTAEIQDLLDVLLVQELDASEDLIAEGTHSADLHLVWDGELDVLMNTPEGERKVAEIGPGEILGEISLMAPGPATATVRSEQGCVTLHLSRAALESFWEKHPHIASVFLEELSRSVATRIRTANAYLGSLRAAQNMSPARATDSIVGVHTKLFKTESE